MSDWPALRQYDGEHLARVALPMLLCLLLSACVKQRTPVDQPAGPAETVDPIRVLLDATPRNQKVPLFPDRPVEGDRIDDALARAVAAGQYKTTDPDSAEPLAADADPQAEPEAAIRIVHHRELADMDRKGIFLDKPITAAIYIRLPDELDLEKYTFLHFRAKISGGRAGYLSVGFVSKPIQWGLASPAERKGLTGVAADCPLDAGPWSLYTVPLHYRKAALARSRWLKLGTHQMGRLPDEPADQIISLKDFTLSTAPAGHCVGWAVDPQRIAVCQTGFEPLHEKQALLSGENPAETFTLREAATDEVVFTGPVRRVKSAVGTTAVLDFTPVTATGRYVLAVGELRSAPFPIAPGAWRTVTDAVGRWIYDMRCGQATAYHGPCHLDDAYLSRWKDPAQRTGLEKIRHLDVSGSWHDAGDCRTYYRYSGEIPHAAMRIAESGYGSPDDPFSMAWWGIRHLRKLSHPDTGDLFMTIWHGRPGNDFRAGDYWTDNIPGNDDDRHVMGHTWEMNVAAEGITGSANFARLAKDTQPEKARAALAWATVQWERLFEPDKGKMMVHPQFRRAWQSRGDHSDHRNRNLAWYGGASLAMYRTTGQQKYLDLARRVADLLIRAEDRNFVGDSHVIGGLFSSAKNDFDRYEPQRFLAEMLLALPDDPDAPRWRETLVRSARWLLKETRRQWAPFAVGHVEVPAEQFEVSPQNFGVVLRRDAAGQPAEYLVPSSRRTQADTIGAMAVVGRALGDLELQRLARRQAEWILGRNPFGVSCICGLGEDSLNQFYSFAQGRMFGCLGADFCMGKKVVLPHRSYGVPSILRPRGPEPFVEGGFRVLEGIASATAPARLELTVTEGSSPWAGEVRITWPRSGKDHLVASMRTDPAGQAGPIELTGGVEYRLHLGELVMPLTAPAGARLRLTLDRTRLLSVRCDEPLAISNATPTIVPVTVTNHGSAAATLKLDSRARNLKVVEIPAVTVQPGTSQTLPLRLQGGRSTRPWVLCLQDPATGQWVLDLTGTVVPDAPQEGSQ